jgi:putative membrane protein
MEIYRYMAEEKSNGKRSLKEYFGVLFSGFAMGSANIIPGVSGGTMALILGIYEELIDSIKAFTTVDAIKMILGFKIKDAFEKLPWRFLLALGIGVLIATASLAKFLGWALNNYPPLVWAFFFGLVVASIISVAKKIKKWTVSRYMGVILGTIAAYLIVGMAPTQTPETWWFLVISGVIAICAMILPGISGSFLLVLMGKYQYILNAVNERDFMVLFWAGLGAVAGLVSFVQLLSWLFKRYHDLTIAILIGFMVGSLRKIWPWKETIESIVIRGKERPLIQDNILPPSYDTMFYAALALAVIGVVSVFAMEFIATRKDKKDA